MPMPNPTGDPGPKRLILNERRLLVVLSVLVLALLAAVVWLAFTVMSLKRQLDNAAPKALIEAHPRAIALVDWSPH